MKCRCGREGTERYLVNKDGEAEGSLIACDECLAEGKKEIEEGRTLFNAMVANGMTESEANQRMVEMMRMEDQSV
jgi:hypothetical protein